ncbi:T9SS type A sorting domain-containing protein [Larkinella arboricola]
MKKVATLLLMLSGFPVFSTHLIGGYIQAERVSGSLTFEFTVNLYMNDTGGNDQTDPIQLCPGDGAGPITVPRQAQLRVGKSIIRSIYKIRHTYSGTGSGTYTVSVQIANRSEVNNLPNSIQTPFYLETTFSSTVVNNLPVFQGPVPESLTVPVNRKAVYNFLATDTDGDSVAHYVIRLRNGECQKTSQQLSDYVFPNDVSRKGTFKIDPKTGLVIWDAPTEVGLYNFAVVAEEWRNGQRISTTVFDMVTRVVDQAGRNPDAIPPYEPVLERGLLTAVEERINEPALTVTVSPSPSENRFLVRMKSRTPTTATFQLLDSQGRLMQETTTRTATLEIEQALGHEKLVPGLYLIRTSARGRVYTTKVIKR